nr:hypothetical protein [Tanacetum cinerariifolium]
MARRGGKVEVGFDNFGGGGEEIINCGGNGGRGSSIFRRGRGSLAICSMESKDGQEEEGWLLLVEGEEFLDGWFGASGGEVKGGGVDLEVTKSLLGPYTSSTVIILVVPATENSPAVPERTTVEITLNMSPENKAYFESEKEAIHLILSGTGDEIYSTVDACKTTHEMWEAIEMI